MITRPLDLASTLRRAPRNFDWVFYVNFGLIALFFVLFGSRFVLSPALAVDGKNIDLSTVPEGTAGYAATSLVVSVKSNGQMVVDPNGLVDEAQLKLWLAERARRTPGARLLVRADESVSFSKLAVITTAAKDVGLFPYFAVGTTKARAGQ